MDDTKYGENQSDDKQGFQTPWIDDDREGVPPPGLGQQEKNGLKRQLKSRHVSMIR